MGTNAFNMREVDGVYYLYDGDQRVISPYDTAIYTRSKRLVDYIMEDVNKYGLNWDSLESVLGYHAFYCAYDEDPEKLDGIEEYYEEILYIDDFWAFDEPIQMRAMVVNRYKSWMPNELCELPLNKQVVFLNMASLLNSVIFPYKILQYVDDEGDSSFLDVDDFVENIDQYMEYLQVAASENKQERIMLYKNIVDTFCKYYYLEEL